jgi:hypothetical protein
MSCNISNLINCLNPFNLCSKTEVDQFDIPMENLDSSSEGEYVALEIINSSSPIPTSASPVQIARERLENKEYNKEQTALVKAVGLRGLTQAEVRQKGFSVIIFNTIDSQDKAFEKTIEAERAEQKFYKVFRERCDQLGIQPSDFDFGVYAKAAMDGLIQESQTKETSCFKIFCCCCAEEENYEVNSVKMDTTITNFSERVFKDMVNDYANKSAEFITPDSFVKQSQFIQGFFPENSLVVIEASLRQALRLKHEGSFIKISEKYLNPSYDNRKVVDTAQRLAQMFRSEEMAIGAELAELRGPTGWNGTMNAAQEKMHHAEIELREAEVKFRSVYNDCFLVVSFPTNPEELMAALNDLSVPCALQEAVELFKEKHAKLQDAIKERDVLIARLNELAQFDMNGNIVGGEFFEISNKLGCVGIIARQEATKTGNFYRELNSVVNSKNQQARHNAIHKFI